MTNTLKDNLQIFSVLLSRDMKLFMGNLGNLFADLSMPLVAQILNFGYLFPLLGMPDTMIIPVYLGSMVNLFVQLGFAFTMRIAADINTNRFIDYQRTLPLPKRWLMGAYIVSNMIETAVIMIPLTCVGLIILRAHLSFAHVSYGALIAVLCVNLLFFATFFLACALYFNFNWLIDNIWPRLLSPMFCISAILIFFKPAYAWWPLLGYIMLLNPFTYVAEGMRSALLGSELYIAPGICIAALSLFIILNGLLIMRGMTKKLDPV